VALIFVYYGFYIIPLLFNKNRRIGIQRVNTEISKLRKIPVKNIEEQKKFLNLRYPKTIGRFKWSQKVLTSILFRLFLFILCLRGLLYAFAYFNLTIPLWFGILFMVVFPIIVNLLLEKFGVEKGSMLVFFR